MPDLEWWEELASWEALSRAVEAPAADAPLVRAPGPAGGFVEQAWPGVWPLVLAQPAPGPDPLWYDAEEARARGR